MKTMPTCANRTLLRYCRFAVLGLGGALAIAQQPNQGQDPALANMAPGDGSAAQQYSAPQYSAQPGQQGDYQQQAPAPVQRSAPSPNGMAPAGQPQYAPGQSQYPNQQQYQQAPSDNYGYQGGDPNAYSGDPQMAGQEALSDDDLYSDQAPPPLPDYDQPEAPDDDYMWTPGYWGWGDMGYYWVPGAWVMPPYYGALWTPGYWCWYGSRYRWYPGYWGDHVGYYGGVNYGFGYIGIGYFGGYWRGNSFVYNTAVTRVGPGIRSVYNHQVVWGGRTYGPRADVRVSYNGGRGGINVQPRPSEMAAMHEMHTGPLQGQAQMRYNARTNPQASFSANHGRVPTAVAVQSRPVGSDHPIAANSSVFRQQRGFQGGQQSGQRGGFQQGGFQQNGAGQQPGQRGGFQQQQGGQPQNPGQRGGFQQGGQPQQGAGQQPGARFNGNPGAMQGDHVFSHQGGQPGSDQRGGFQQNGGQPQQQVGQPQGGGQQRGFQPQGGQPGGQQQGGFQPRMNPQGQPGGAQPHWQPQGGGQQPQMQRQPQMQQQPQRQMQQPQMQMRSAPPPAQHSAPPPPHK